MWRCGYSDLTRSSITAVSGSAVTLSSATAYNLQKRKRENPHGQNSCFLCNLSDANEVIHGQNGCFLCNSSDANVISAQVGDTCPGWSQWRRGRARGTAPQIQGTPHREAFKGFPSRQDAGCWRPLMRKWRSCAHLLFFDRRLHEGGRSRICAVDHACRTGPKYRARTHTQTHARNEFPRLLTDHRARVHIFAISSNGLSTNAQSCSSWLQRAAPAFAEGCNALQWVDGAGQRRGAAYRWS